MEDKYKSFKTGVRSRKIRTEGRGTQVITQGTDQVITTVDGD